MPRSGSPLLVRCVAQGSRLGLVTAALSLTLLLDSTAWGLETDQYYAWGRQLEDSAELLDAKVNLELEAAAAEVSSRPGGRSSCSDVAAELHRRLHFSTFQNLEVWAFRTALLSRVPADPAEELEYRLHNLYSNHGLVDIGTWLPNSPTIEVDGIRFGTDKLAHFVSSGWRWYLNSADARRDGLKPAAAELRMVRDGVFWERTMLGRMASGVLSRADLEASYQGAVFYRNLCEGDEPTLAFVDGRWQVVRPFDIRRHVSPEWDESYQPSLYSKSRWRKVQPVLATYCDRLSLPAVQRQRELYRERDRLTPVEALVDQLVRDGQLDDPRRFSIEQTCHGHGATPTVPVALPSGLRTDPAAGGLDLDLMGEIARRDADRTTRAVGLVGLGLDYPAGPSASAGVMLARLPREYECRTVCSFQGPTVQLGVGPGAGRLGVGWARVVGEQRGAGAFITKPHIGIGAKGLLLSTWGDPIGEPSGATFLGGEFEFTIVQVNFRLATLVQVDGPSRDDPWLLSGGVGWGF